MKVQIEDLLFFVKSDLPIFGDAGESDLPIFEDVWECNLLFFGDIGDESDQPDDATLNRSER